jgi:hypothetical protein
MAQRTLALGTRELSRRMKARTATGVLPMAVLRKPVAPPVSWSVLGDVSISGVIGDHLRAQRIDPPRTDAAEFRRTSETNGGVPAP